MHLWIRVAPFSKSSRDSADAVVGPRNVSRGPCFRNRITLVPFSFLPSCWLRSLFWCERRLGWVSQACAALTCLDLSFNVIASTAGIHRVVACVTCLVLRCNNVRRTTGLEHLLTLRSLDLAGNLLSGTKTCSILIQLVRPLRTAEPVEDFFVFDVSASQSWIPVFAKKAVSPFVAHVSSLDFRETADETNVRRVGSTLGYDAIENDFLWNNEGLRNLCCALWKYR